jgi:adenylate kinase family enzyme
VPLLGPDDQLPNRPARVVVAGTSGAGKTTLAARVGRELGIPHVELDALFHGPDWTPRREFVADVRRFCATDTWVTEWQYERVRHLLAMRADLLVWLDLSRTRVTWQVTRRTVRRRLRRERLWNGNVERPLWTVFTDPQHIVRWAWTRHPHTAARVAAARDERPELVVVRLPGHRAAERWIAGPLAESARRPRS